MSTSRATDEVNGITMMARIRPAANMPTPSGGPLKIGKSLSEAGQDVSIARTAGTRTKMPQRPYTMDGMAASSSVRYRSGCLSQFGQSSEIKTAMPSAIGVASARARIDE